MLGAASILEVFRGKNFEALIILVFLLLNGFLAVTMEQRGQIALELLQSHLEIRSRVTRDSIWQMTSARNLVPGDLHVRTGDFVPDRSSGGERETEL
jgi:magnesium-transporting ATPase (P-type)